MNNQILFNKLRAEHPLFIYKDYVIEDTPDTLNITYNFEIPELALFAPKWQIPKKSPDSPDIDSIEKLVFSLGMVELISYWKTCCCPQVRVEAGVLSDAQIQWWKKLYFHGLGEFFYLNGIETSMSDFMNITCIGEAVEKENSASEDSVFNKDGSVLIPVGGGKDSAVTIDILSDSFDSYAYIINPRGATLNTVKVSGIPEEKLLVAKRTLDKNMLRLNSEGYLNGHTPYSAIVAFSSVLTAEINGLSFVALSNESSANESTVQGSDVNHQYSKSLEFESDFTDYIRRYIDTDVYYFSLLRPLAEIQIAKYFAALKEYHPIFRSCNAGSKQDIWCAKCPKCLFVYIILAPFLTEQELTEIFGKNMLDDENMREDFRKLIGFLPEKPFECVGSRDEVCASLRSLITEREALPLLVSEYRDFIIRNSCALSEYWLHYDTENGVPAHFEDVLCRKLKEKGVYI